MRKMFKDRYCYCTFVETNYNCKNTWLTKLRMPQGQKVFHNILHAVQNISGYYLYALIIWAARFTLILMLLQICQNLKCILSENEI